MQKVSEAQVLRDCNVLLTYFRHRGYLTFKRINVGAIIHSDRRGIHFRKNPMAGMADLMVFLHKEFGGHVLHIEAKAPARGKLSDVQKAWRDELAAIGHETYYEVTSQQALVGILKLYGVPTELWGAI